MPRRALPRNLLPSSTSVTSPRRREPAGTAVSPPTRTSRVTRASTRSSSFAVELETVFSICRPITDPASSVYSANVGCGGSGGGSGRAGSASTGGGDARLLGFGGAIAPRAGFGRDRARRTARDGRTRAAVGRGGRRGRRFGRGRRTARRRSLARRMRAPGPDVPREDAACRPGRSTPAGTPRRAPLPERPGAEGVGG